MATQETPRTSESFGKSRTRSTFEKKVMAEARRLILESLLEEEHRWTEIGSEVEKALEGELLSPKGRKQLLDVLEERDSRFASIFARRLDMRVRGRS